MFFRKFKSRDKDSSSFDFYINHFSYFHSIFQSFRNKSEKCLHFLFCKKRIVSVHHSRSVWIFYLVSSSHSHNYVLSFFISFIYIIAIIACNNWDFVFF